MADTIRVENARVHNLKAITLDIPRNQVVAFTGVSGSGKSSLVFDTLHTEAQRQLVETFSSFSRRYLPKLSRPDVDEIRNLSTSIVIDQRRLGRTLRSTVGTATEVYTYLRMLFSRCGDGESMASYHFSFNVPPGWCVACEGLGKQIRIDTDLLLDRTRSLRDGAVTHPDWKVGGFLWTELIHCGLFDPDKRIDDYDRDELELLLRTEGVPVDGRARGLHRKTFIGLATRLEHLYGKKADDEAADGRTGNVYVLDEPTTGLHLSDIDRLMAIIEQLVDDGNSVIVIEHNLQVIARADWVIDLGPEGGSRGGRVLAVGTPEDVAACGESHTARYLQAVLGGSPSALPALV
jgi:excinuclease UvrABC ATPase subunit